MTRQCIGCGAFFPEGARTRYCLPCWKAHRREQNRTNTRASRARAREARPSAVQLPTEAEIQWLDQINLGLGQPVREMVHLVESGMSGDDPELLAAAKGALDRYDANRFEFDARVIQRPDPEGFATGLRDFFEYLRGALQ